MLDRPAVVSRALRFQRQFEQSLGVHPARTLHRLRESVAGFPVSPQILKRDSQRVRGRWILAFTQLERSAVFGYSLARASEPMFANSDVETGAGLMTAGPIQRTPIFEDRQLVLPAMEKPVPSLYRLGCVVYLGLDPHGACRQRNEQQCNEDSI
jgi:hypothetical protein